MSMPHMHLRPRDLRLKRPFVSALILGLALSVTALGQPVGAATTDPDLGDAPASTNNYATNMPLYPMGPFAQFPTVFFANTQPTGPKHFNNPTLYYLGNTSGTITCETQADVGPDCDGNVTNIYPPSNAADRDKGDDGITWPLFSATCQKTQVRYYVTVLPGAPSTAYVNSWVDWNSNGKWGDIFPCSGLNVDEWIVQNQVITFPGPGVYLFSTPGFISTPKTNRPQWARLTLSESPANWTAARFGSGPASGWKLGETEDYILP
jgi:hypothetical protein